MTNPHPDKYDIAIIGGGSTGLALAFHLALQAKRSLSVIIIESRNEYHNDRTWCFWDFNELHTILEPCIRRKWHSWSFSSEQNTIIHDSDSHPYCAVAAGDYYRIVLETIGEYSNFHLVTSCQAHKVKTSGDGYLIATSQGDLWSKYVIDTRPPITNYHYTQNLPMETRFTSDFPGAMLYQIFFGVEIELEFEIFKESRVQLMTELTEEFKGLSFKYILPYSKKRALIEYTTFTPLFFNFHHLKKHCLNYLKRLVATHEYDIIYEEGAILPMGFTGLKSTQRNVLNAGIRGGSVRDSTGYAFIRTQRWATRCASDLINGKLSQSMGCDNFFDHYLDKIFLRVLRNNPHLSPSLFMQLATALSADAFARFMMDKGSLQDYMNVIVAMPKRPFIQQIYSSN